MRATLPIVTILVLLAVAGCAGKQAPSTVPIPLGPALVAADPTALPEAGPTGTVTARPTTRPSVSVSRGPLPAATTTPAGAATGASGATASPLSTASPSPAASPLPTPAPSATPTGAPSAAARGIADPGPVLVNYGDPAGLGGLAQAAATYRLFIVQAGSYTADQIAQLRAGGRNHVLAYLDVGSVEHSAPWWTTAPGGFVPAGKQTGAQIGPYGGYPDETWMNPSNGDWHHLLVDLIAPDALGTGADGLMLDNLELVEHGAGAADGPCDATCAAAGLDLVYALRQKFPDKLLVQNNATSEAVRTASVLGQPYPTLLDGVLHESVFTQPDAAGTTYHVETDAAVVAQLDAWSGMGLKPGGHPFWIGTLDFVNACSNTADAQQVAAQARAHGYVPAVSDKSAGLNVVCGAP